LALSPYNDNLQINSPKPVDNRWGRFVVATGGWRPYLDMSEFMTVQAFGARYETMVVFVRSTTNADRSDIFILDKNKDPYLLVPEVDLSNYYDKDDINGFNADLLTLINTAQSSANSALSQVLDVNEALQDLDQSLAVVAKTGSYNDLSDKPTIPPTAPVQSVNGRVGAVTGLAEQSSLDATNTAVSQKANTSGQAFTGNISAPNLSGTNTGDQTKSSLGLGNVDNTSDADKPISTAQNTALGLKAPLASPNFQGSPTAPTPASGDNSQRIATTAFVIEATSTDITPDASTVVKGKVKLAGDLSGTADLPTVPGLANKSNINGQVFTGNISAPNLSGVNTGDQDLSSLATKLELQTERETRSNRDENLDDKIDLEITNRQADTTYTQNQINLNDSKLTNQVITASGSFTVTLTQLIGQYTKTFFKDGVAYRISGVADEATRKVSLDTITGVVTSSVPFYGETVWGEYQGISGGVAFSDSPIVQNYSDIVTHPTWGGNRVITYYVLTDNQNMGGKKGAYRYVPTFTPTPAQLAINFND